jgi:hypothetical protein
MDRRGEERGEDRAGLVGLGLIMELVGSVVAAYLIVKTLEPVLDRVFRGLWYPKWEWQSLGGHSERGSSAPPLHVALLAAIGVLRALMHRRAGSAVLYRPAGAASAVINYAAVALGHTALCLLAFRLHRDNQTFAWAVGACLSVGWPIALLIAVRRREIRGLLSTGPSATGASAPDQVGTLMVFLGMVGGLVALFALYAAIEGYTIWSWPASRLSIAVAALLCFRSVVHTRVGLRLAGREVGSSEPMNVASYVKAGLVTAALSWIAILVMLGGLFSPPQGGLPPLEHLRLASAGLAVYLLFVWPLLVHRLARARADAAEPVTTATRSSSGLPALGWLLLAAGAVQVGVAGLWFLLGEDRLIWTMRSFVEPMSGDGVSRGPWLQLLIAVPQIWVALELLRGSARRRRAATVYAACASVATVVSIQADQHLLMKAIALGLPDPTGLAVYLPVAFWLLVPVATLVFVQAQLRREGAGAPKHSNGGEA